MWLERANRDVADICTGQGRVEEAVDMFKASLASDRHASHIPHMYLGQVYPGKKGLRHMRQGVALLEKALDAKERKREAGGVAGLGDRGSTFALYEARCALAEALLAEDDSGGSDEEAESLLRAAMLSLPDAADAHQVCRGSSPASPV